MMLIIRCYVFFGLVLTLLLTPGVHALDDSHWTQADRAIHRGIAYLRGTQNDDGSWSPQPGPAITAMVVAAMLDRPDISTNDPAVGKALGYILSKCKKDGGIHDGMLENYNTAICLTALARVHDRPGVAQAISNAQDYLRDLQWHDQTDASGGGVDPSHPFYGGAGYGRHGRPDLSNTQVMLEGLHQSGLDSNDPAFGRALVFITRCQGSKSNKKLGDKIVQDGGFIYTTSVNKDLLGVPQSMASPEMIDKAKQGQPVSGLRTYGSMTYAGFKSLIYANLDRDDPRVVDAFNWIRHHYTLEQNPGMPGPQKMHGYFYYLTAFSRALDAWGIDRVTTADGQPHDWSNDLIDTLAGVQREDGAWVNEADRWLEGDTNLTTAYALTALGHALK